MEIPLLIAMGILAVLLLILLIRMSLSMRNMDEMRLRISSLSGSLTTMQGEMQGVSGRISHDGSEIRRMIHEQLMSIQSVVEHGRSTMNNQINSIHSSYVSIAEQLSKLEEATESVKQMGSDMLSLQELFSRPKGMGEFGEFLLEKELADVLPAEHYKTQYQFGGLQADAVIFFPHGMVAIDAKFPMVTYRRYHECNDEDERKKLRRDFVKSVRERIDETSKYIIPSEGTLNFAIMFIPSEAVFHEAFLRDTELLDYAINKCHVYPTSPITFHFYLSTAAIGLRGLTLEKKTERVLKLLGGLSKGLGDTVVTLDKSLGQLQNAQNNISSANETLKRTRQEIEWLEDESIESNGG